MIAIVAMVLARARQHALGWLLVVAGIAIATALPVLTAASTRVASSAALEHGLRELAPGQRSVSVTFDGRLAGDDLSTVEAVVRHQVSRLSTVRPRRQVEYRRMRNQHRQEFTLGAVEGLREVTELTSGRWPRQCDPTRCEVVQVGPAATPDTSSIDVIVVGRVRRLDPLFLSGTFDPGKDAPLLLGSDTAALSGIDVLDLFQRSWGWIVPLDLDRVERLGVEAYVGRENAVADQLGRARRGLTITAPDDVLRDADERARRSASRFALLGSTSATLVLGLAVVAAVSTRRDHLAVVRLLRTRGGTRGQTAAFTTSEAAWPAVAGLLLGLGGAVLVTGVTWGMQVAETGLRGGVLTAAVLAAAAAAGVGLTLRWAPEAAGRAAWQAVSVAGTVSIAAALLAASRGSADVGAEGRADPLLSLLPVLTAISAGLIAARAWPLVPVLLNRLTPSRAVAMRLAAAGTGRRPLRPAATAAVIAATCTSVVFAIGYRATLERGAADQAAYGVPMVARLTTGTTLERPADLLATEPLTGQVPSAVTYPVLRASGAFDLTRLLAAPVQLVGVDPTALLRVAHWRHDYANRSPAAVAQLLRTKRERSGPSVPDAAKQITLSYTGSLTHLDVLALFHDGGGRSLPISLTAKGKSLTGILPAGASRTFDGVVIREDTQAATAREHRNSEGFNIAPPRLGRLVLGSPVVDGSPLSGSINDWVVSEPNNAKASGNSLEVDYRIDGDTVQLRPYPSAAGVLPAYVDRRTAAAARDGVVSIGIGGGYRLRLHVVDSGSRFPTTSGRFAVLDRLALAAALDQVTVGSGNASEVWVWSPQSRAGQVGRALHQTPYDQLAVRTRADAENALRSDPVARMSSRLLLVTSMVGIVVAGLCVVLLVSAERSESAGELFAREADGTRPRRLRVALLLRASAAVLLGVPVGLVAGLALTQATATLVTVTATGTAANPPLVIATSPGQVTIALVALLSLALVVAGAVAARSLRGPLPVPPETDLR